jgi:hypothetical protein
LHQDHGPKVISIGTPDTGGFTDIDAELINIVPQRDDVAVQVVLPGVVDPGRLFILAPDPDFKPLPPR